MKRAYGHNVRLLFGFETQYGDGGADFYKIPLISSSLDSEQPLISSNVLGLGRDPTQPFQDVINVEGDIAIPIDIRTIGLWLKALFGMPETIEDADNQGSYIHEFKSGKDELPSFALELGFPNLPEYIKFSGVMANSIALNFQRSGEAQATVAMMAQAENSGNIPITATPTELSYTRVSQFLGSIKSGGLLLGNITAASLNFSNNLEKVDSIRDDAKIEGIDPTICSLTGSITARYDKGYLQDKAKSGDPIDMELSYIINDTCKMVFHAHEVYLPKPKRSVDGPGGIECTYDWQAAKHEAIGNMLTVTLVNDIEEY